MHYIIGVILTVLYNKKAYGFYSSIVCEVGMAVVRFFLISIALNPNKNRFSGWNLAYFLKGLKLYKPILLVVLFIVSWTWYWSDSPIYKRPTALARYINFCTNLAGF